MANLYADREPVTRRTRDRPWIADFEADEHATDQQLTAAEAVDAVERTQSDRFVDFVTHEQRGHPMAYLYKAVRSGDRSVTLSYGLL